MKIERTPENELDLEISGELIYSQNARLFENKLKLSQYGFALVKNNE